MFYVPTRRPLGQRFASAARRAFRATAVRVLDRLDPAPIPASVAVEPAPAAAPKLLTAGEMPPVEVIDAAAVAFDRAAEAARVADRGKRKARKLLDLLPDGVYGRVTIERVPSTKTTPDLKQIAADYARAGLGEAPMRLVAPTLRVTVAPAVETLEVVAA